MSNDKPTNGDVFKSTFPNLNVTETSKDFVLVAFPREKVAIWDKWWSAPYEGTNEHR